jgi:hypothetical protein
MAGNLEGRMNNTSTTRPENAEVICTLFEGDYHLGTAVLLNSIIRGGFRGLFWLGYRGSLPPWAELLERTEQGFYRAGEALLAFEAIDNASHFTQFKPEFMRSLIDRRIATRNLWYFDPDITVRCEWEFFERWIQFGVCLCQDITMGTMPSNHPIRCEWMEAAKKIGWSAPVSVQERYYNGGFVALNVDHREFLETWIEAMKLANSAGVDPRKLQHGTRANAFYSTDQDALNVAAMYSRSPLSAIGPEGMGFIRGGFTMYHTVGGKKPWRKKFLRAALAGDPPWNGDKHFLDCAEGPIRPYSAGQLKSLRRTANFGTLIGRFYRRH